MTELPIPLPTPHGRRSPEHRRLSLMMVRLLGARDEHLRLIEQSVSSDVHVRVTNHRDWAPVGQRAGGAGLLTNYSNCWRRARRRLSMPCDAPSEC